MYFGVARIKLSETKIPKFETLYLEKYMCDESGFLRDNKP